MRLVLFVLLAGAIVSGCAAPGGAARTTSQRTKSPVAAGDKSSASDQTQQGRPEVRADNSVGGKVASVNPTLRFIVMDFPLRRMPAFEQRLNVYRGGQKVGEVKVTGPSLDTTIAGDIIMGEAQIGDEVRED